MNPKEEKEIKEIIEGSFSDSDEFKVKTEACLLEFTDSSSHKPKG